MCYDEVQWWSKCKETRVHKCWECEIIEKMEVETSKSSLKWPKPDKFSFMGHNTVELQHSPWFSPNPVLAHREHCAPINAYCSSMFGSVAGRVTEFSKYSAIIF